MPGEERAALALLRRGFTVVPHMEIRDQLPASLEHVDQRHPARSADERRMGVHLDHRQRPPRGRDLVAFPGVRFLPHQQPVELGLPASPVNSLGQWVGSAFRRHRYLSFN